MLRFETPLAHTPYNSVMRFQVGDFVDETIDAVLDSYQQTRVPVMWVVHPTAQPADLTERLVARGLVEAEIVPGMVARLDEIPRSTLPPSTSSPRRSPPTNVTLSSSSPRGAIRYPPTPRRHCDPSSKLLSFGEPGASTQGWLARLDGAVVSKVVLHVDADVAGIYGVATKPEAAGSRPPRTLTLQALHAARSAGIDIGVLHSTPMARSLYEGIGFHTVAADLVLYSTPDTLHL